MPQMRTRTRKKKARRTRIRRRKKVCYFTANKVDPDYKDVDTLRRFVNERGKIVPRRLSGVKAPKQRKLAVAIKRARFLGLLPFVAENIR